MKDKKNKLKNCPFCGGLAQEIIIHDGSDLVKIECFNCQASIMDYNLLAVRKMWNTRELEKIPQICVECSRDCKSGENLKCFEFIKKKSTIKKEIKKTI